MNFYEIFLLVILFGISTFIFLYAVRSFFFLVVVLFPNLKLFHSDFLLLRVISNTIQKYFKNIVNEKYTGFEGKKNPIIKKEDAFTNTISYLPFISILIASFNENFVIDRLLSSIYNLEYDNNKYEIIIVDDSNDNTSELLKLWEKKMINLKIIHRQKRDGWKGVALNKAIDNINSKSTISLIVDADNILKKNTLLHIATLFLNSKSSVFVIQGYPISVVFERQNKFLGKQQKLTDYQISNSIKENWIARGISFRLLQRNLIEFVAKEKLGLPLPITGSLFAVKTEILKSIKFSTDLCEDWDLTLDLYLSKFFNNDDKFYLSEKEEYSFKEDFYCKNFKKKFRNLKIITFNHNFVSFTEASEKLPAYFRQRKRVSEGHTRGFKKKMINVLKNSKLPLSYKMELIFMGLRYSKYVIIVGLIIFDIILLFEKGPIAILKDDHLKVLFGLQSFSLVLYLLYNVISVKICFNHKRQFNAKDVVYLLLLNLCTIPAFFIGSIFGFVRKNGVFYRTARN